MVVMDLANDVIDSYQKKIGTYDKQLWEKCVEQQVIKRIRGIENVPKKKSKVKAELIDVDLVRGSSFPKAKPQFSWITVARMGLLRVCLLPFFFRWWREQTSTKFTLLLVLMYFVQLASISVFTLTNDKSQNVTVTDVLTPILLMLFMSIVHAQIVSTHFNHHRSHRGVTAASNSRRTSTSSKSTKSRKTNATNDVDTGGGGTGGGNDEKGSSRSSSRRYSLKNSKLHSSKESLRLSRYSKKSYDSDPSSSRSSRSSRRPEITISALATGVVDDVRLKASTKSLILPAEIKKAENENHGVEIESEKEQELCEYKSRDGEQEVSGNYDESLSVLTEPIVETVGEIILPSNDDNNDLFRLNDSDGLSIAVRHRRRGNNNDDDSIVKTNCCHSDQHSDETKNDSSIEADRAVATTMTTIDTVTVATVATDVGSRRGTVNNVRRRRPRSKTNESKRISSDNLTVDDDMKESCTGQTSSCESEIEIPVTPSSVRKFPHVVRRHILDSSSDGPMSENEWDRMNSDMATSDTSSCTSGSELSDDHETSSHDDPFNLEHHSSVQFTGTVIHSSHTQAHDRVSCYIWEDEDCKKVDLTVLDIGWTIIQRVDKMPETSDYLILGWVLSVTMAIIPAIFRCYVNRGRLLELDATAAAGVGNTNRGLMNVLYDTSWQTWLLILHGMFLRLGLGFIFFFLLSVAERTFKQRLLYAKHFCYLTSSRRARKYDLPHFRLNKVRNIKTWLSLRSYLKKRGPQRSVDVIVSASFLLAVTLVALMCVQLLKETESFLDELYNWELVLWCLSLATYLLRFMTLGTKINRKYRNLSVLITEQINLYLHMEQKPHKKEELMLANNVLKLAEDLLKELESPFKISGLSANPFLYNLTKVIILSAFSAVLTELLGFKLKLYKIKIKT
ncbi:protein PHTF2-like isoform X2 [Tubulanus polymorphus]|uniref:protein PHTF2-like isoform X2 n=1 Tax=Tubulanus polymorphus TaxID=672921 RepID=UPI003DA2B9E0